MSKIGLGILTYNRPDFFKECFNSVDKSRLDELIIVNDGTPYNNIDMGNVNIIQHKKNQGIGISKNDAMKFLVEKNCDYIFLIEDDIFIKNNNVFDEYINASKISGLKHMMYGYHGPANKKTKIPNPRIVIEYDKNTKIALNQHCVGAFCFYTKDVLQTVGYNDDHFINAWEHVEHSYRIVKEGYLPAYWWWPDIANSNDFLDEQACSEVSSTIRPQNNWKSNIEMGAKHFIKKHGLSPVSIPDTSLNDVKKTLKNIYKKYANS
jgi:GT2 family glycosyltransferase